MDGCRGRKGASNQIVLPYDEVLIIVRGTLSVRRPDGVATAGSGEIIVHRAGATVEYEAAVEVVYVSHPALPLEAGGSFQPADHPLVEQFVPETKK